MHTPDLSFYMLWIVITYKYMHTQLIFVCTTINTYHSAGMRMNDNYNYPQLHFIHLYRG